VTAKHQQQPFLKFTVRPQRDIHGALI